MDRLLFNHSSYFDDFSIIGITSAPFYLLEGLSNTIFVCILYVLNSLIE